MVSRRRRCRQWRSSERLSPQAQNVTVISACRIPAPAVLGPSFEQLEQIGFDLRAAGAEWRQAQEKPSEAWGSRARHDCRPSAMAFQMRSRTRWSSRAVRQAERRHRVEALGFATTSGRRVSQRRSHEALGLEPGQRRIDGADRHVAAGRVFNVLLHWHGVGVIAERPHGEECELLELSQFVAFHGHTDIMITSRLYR